MSKRERGGKKEGEEEHAKVVKTADSEETASIRDVNAFAEELAGAAGPDLLLAIRKVRGWGDFAPSKSFAFIPPAFRVGHHSRDLLSV